MCVPPLDVVVTSSNQISASHTKNPDTIEDFRCVAGGMYYKGVL
jgi:hypothetical protein